DGEGSAELEDLLQIHPLHVLHRDVMNLALPAELYDLHGILVLEMGGVTRFSLEAGDQVEIGGEMGMESLDHHDAAQRGLDRAVHGAHRAGAESLRDLESSESRRNVHRVLIRGRRSDGTACLCAAPWCDDRGTVVAL